MSDKLPLFSIAALILLNYASCVALENASDCVDNFCEVVDNYPLDAINNIIKGLEQYEEFLNSVDVSLPIGRKSIFNSATDESLCETIQSITFPRMAVNTNKERRLIVNTNQYKQSLILEICRANTQCKFSDLFPNQVQSSCKQKYLKRRMLSTEMNGLNASIDVFDVPCCCVCSIQKS